MDVWAKLLEYSPLPNKLSQEISQALMQPPSPEQQQAQQMEVAGKQLELRKTASEAQLNEARAGKEKADTGKSVVETRRAALEPISYPDAMVAG